MVQAVAVWQQFIEHSPFFAVLQAPNAVEWCLPVSLFSHGNVAAAPGDTVGLVAICTLSESVPGTRRRLSAVARPRGEPTGFASWT